MTEELGVDVDVKEDDYCCARKPWIDMGKTVCLSGEGGEPRRFSRPLPLRSSGGEKGASKKVGAAQRIRRKLPCPLPCMNLWPNCGRIHDFFAY